MATPSQDLARLMRLLNQPALTNLPAVNRTSGEVQVIALGPGTLDRVVLTVEPGKQYNLLDYAPQLWWVASTTLVFAVEHLWIHIPDDGGQPTPSPAPQIAEVIQYVVQPEDPGIGDLMVWNGAAWVLLSPTTAGYVLTSNGPITVPSYQPGGGGGGGGNVITGQSTAGLANGDFAYVFANNTWGKARNDGSLLQATCIGHNAGTAGTMLLSGSVSESAKFTTVGGLPISGDVVYLAASTDDGGTGLGKLSATPPTTPGSYLVIVGTCIDNTNYAALKTCRVEFNPQPPILL